MQGILLFALVATIVFAPAMVQGRQLSSSFLQELARMMTTTDDLIYKGMRGDRCYVEITKNGRTENKLLKVGEEIASPSDSCELHTCTEGGLIQNACPPLECDASNPLVYLPGRCCPICRPPSGPAECRFTPWSEFGQCSVTCGGGQRVRMRELIVDDSGSSINCQGRLTDFENCNEEPCERQENEGECTFSTWSEFGRCSVTCGGGLRARVRQLLSINNNGSSVNCQGQLTDFESCNELPCPIDCVYEERTQGSCVPNCGGGEIRKFIVITQQPMHGGNPCPPTDVEVTKCCQNCEFREDCRSCSATCNGGTRTCTPIITKPAVGGGRACPAPRIERCNENICPVDCQYEYECSACSRDCTKTCIPRITQPAIGTGARCPGTIVEQCDASECPVDCDWEEVTEGQCIPNCGGGQLVKYYVITQQARNGGHECPAHVRDNIGVHRTEQCCKNCVLKKRTTECSVTCGDEGDGFRTRYEVITEPKVNGGFCPELKNQTIPCLSLPPCIICEGDLKPCKSSSGGYVCINDTDGDCVPDETDNCVKVINPEQKDQDRDGFGDKCDNCVYAYNPNQENSDDDTTGDACDADDDNDGKLDQNDNCPRNPNPTQADRDKDKVGDACDNCPYKWNMNQADYDKDGSGNACDNCRFYPNPKQLATDRRTYGTKCTVRPKGLAEVEEEDIEYEENKKNMIVQTMEKLLEMYYSN